MRIRSFGSPQHAAQFWKELQRVLAQDLPTDSHGVLFMKLAAIDFFRECLGKTLPPHLGRRIDPCCPHDAIRGDGVVPKPVNPVLLILAGTGIRMQHRRCSLRVLETRWGMRYTEKPPILRRVTFSRTQLVDDTARTYRKLNTALGLTLSGRSRRGNAPPNQCFLIVTKTVCICVSGRVSNGPL